MCIKGRKSQALGLDVGSNPSLTSFCLDNCSSFQIYLFVFGYAGSLLLYSGFL